jgi:hypothetical protein
VLNKGKENHSIIQSNILSITDLFQNVLKGITLADSRIRLYITGVFDMSNCSQMKE